MMLPSKRVLVLIQVAIILLATANYYRLFNGTELDIVEKDAQSIWRQQDMAETNRPSKKTPHDNPTMNKEEPLNIIMFYADDWTAQVLGKLNPHVHTPHIDQMASEGVLFQENAVTTSMCWISRASMLTGTYASRHRFVHPHQDTLFETHPWNETLFPLLKSNGYYTGLVGKWHAPKPRAELQQAFDVQRFYHGNHWEERNGQVRHVTDWNQLDAMEFLRQRPKDQQFALVVSFFATHAWDEHTPPYNAKNDTLQYYQNVTIPRPYTATMRHWKQLPPFFSESSEGRIRWKHRFDPVTFQSSIQSMFRMATEVDLAIGEILKELKRQGVYDNTLLIFTTDNGNLHGEHGLAEKWYPFQESIKVPLVIVDPRMHHSQRGTMSPAFTLNIDLAPTILGAAQIRPSSFMQGRDMAQLYLQSTRQNHAILRQWRQDWFYEYNRGDPITAKGHRGKGSFFGGGWIDASFALITKDYKYIYWPQHDFEQVFDRRQDPWEELDLLHSNSSLWWPPQQQLNVMDDVYLQQLRARYQILKKHIQSGKRA